MTFTVAPSHTFPITDGRDIGMFPAVSECTVAQAATLLGVREGYIEELLDDNLVKHRLDNGNTKCQYRQKNEFSEYALRGRDTNQELETLKFWREQKIYEKSLQSRKDAPRFVFYEGPPTANGLPHPGHCLTRAIKDLYPRYKTMKGFLCQRKGGWDTR